MDSTLSLSSGILPALGSHTLPVKGEGTLPNFSSGCSAGTLGAGDPAHAHRGSSHASTVSVKFHVPIMLDLHANYTKCAFFFNSLCGKFSLRSHIDDSTLPCPNDPHWDAVECYARSWLSSSVNDCVLDLSMIGADSTMGGHDLWMAIEGIIHTNQELCTIFLLNDFHSMVQGDSTTSVYCHCLKAKIAALCNISHPVEDS